ncbi:motility associated factor glycosyltransferase family protein [Paenibacillus riograndensis]|uniref:motility associated factor glycosyltransferase family protein n=1 Tax=Paenibacillus riograndensis TaxID=483937 RepID=UPI000A58AC1A|nr:6-hydroxymethylpterin diphosphokinase MptE-like protein [Paenibacillus riograndensis]
MSYFQQNQIVLQKRFPHVANKMDSLEMKVHVPAGYYFEPLERDELWLEAVRGSVDEQEIIFVYGFGQGVGLADIMEMFPDRLLFVYEPNEENFYNSLSELDLELILEHPKLLFLSVGESHLKVLFYSMCTHLRKEMAFVALRYYLENNPDSLRDLMEDFQKYSDNFYSNKLTQHSFRKDWVRNSLYHLAGMLTSPSIKELYNSYENMTAVIIASGPSLQMDIEWVRRMKPHALIISAGSSIQALVKNGITPHLATLLDGNAINNKVFSNPDTLSAPFMYLSSSYYEIADKKGRDKIHATIQNDWISQYYMGISMHQAEIMPTSTVTGTAIQTAVWLGAKRIVLMGQDLSFPDDKYYSDGVGHFEKDFAEGEVKNSQHSILNVQGTYNVTNPTFLKMKEGLENLFESLPTVEFINSTRKGAVLEGTVWKPAEEVFKLIATDNIGLNTVQDLLEKIDYQPSVDEVESVKSKISTTINDLTWVKQDFKQLSKQLGKLRELSRTNPAKCHRTIVDIEQIWGKIVNQPWFEPVIETILPLEISDFDRELPSVVSEKNLVRKSNLLNDTLGVLIKNIEDEVPFLEEVLGEALRRIEAISAIM